ncbi:MAG: hypothetical protein QOK11_2936 [Pseudonocardiales bacterium]|nr:hypothetical protein [Pseudonocardiales bacterium]
MPNLPWNRQPAPLTPEELAFEALLSGAPLPVDAPRDAYLVGDVMNALRASTTSDELDGFASASSAYRQRYAPSPRFGRGRRRSPATLAGRLSARGAAALAVGAIGIGGIGTAAFAGVLPDTAQNFAHHLLGAPAGHPGNSLANGNGNGDGQVNGKSDGHGRGHSSGNSGGAKTPTPGTPTSSATSTAVGPDPTGAAAFGLCTAYDRAKANGQAADVSIAFANLATAAGGRDKITAYCATVPHPGSASASHSNPTAQPSQSNGHRTGKPTPSHPGDGASTPALSTGAPKNLPALSPSHPAVP